MDESTWASIYALALQIGSLILVPVAGALGTVFVQKIKLNAQRIKGDIWEQTMMVVNTAVLSTEQKSKTGVLSMKNSDRKNNAIVVAKAMLKSKKIKVDDDILDALIEAQVGILSKTFEIPDVKVETLPKTPEIEEAVG